MKPTNTNVVHPGNAAAGYVPIGPVAPDTFRTPYWPGQQHQFRPLSPVAKHDGMVYTAQFPEGDIVSQISAANAARIKQQPLRRGFQGKLKANGLIDPNIIFGGERKGWVSLDVTQVP